MPTFNFVDSFTGYLAEGMINLRRDALKIVLTNVSPSTSDQFFSDLREITPGNGYPAGGVPVTAVFVGRISSSYKVVLQDKTITATGPIGPFRYAALVDTTPTAPPKPIVGWWDYGEAESVDSLDWGGDPLTWNGDPLTWGSSGQASATLSAGMSLTFDFSEANGALLIRPSSLGTDPDDPDTSDAFLWGGSPLTWGGDPLTWS